MDEQPQQRQALRDALAGLLPQDRGSIAPQDLADVLWISRLAGLAPLPASVPDRRPETGVLAGQVADGAPSPAGAVGPSADRPPVRPPATAPAPPAPSPPTAPATGRRPAGEARVRLHALPGGESGATHYGSAHVVQVARLPALTGVLALSRALRPLRQWVDSNGPPRLDEEATAQATSEAGYLLPVWTPAKEPRFSVDLLVDTGATMAVWRELASELYTALECHGAFADVRCLALDTDRPVPRLLPFRRRNPAGGSGPAPSAPWHRPLTDPSGRRILLVLTDGVGPAWWGTHLPGTLARASRTRPTAVLQVLPRRLWHRTALHTASVEARAADPERPRTAFRSEAALPGIPRGPRGTRERAAVRWLPVMEVNASWLAPWAELTAGRTSGWVPMLAAPLHGVRRPRPPARAEDWEVSPAGLVARFRSGCSPLAYRLACHLAAAPLSLPVMRLVQQATVPGSGQTDLAEIFLSGLIQRRGGPAPSRDPDDVVYDFRSGVREELLAELTRGESLRVLDHVLAKVSGRVAATFGGTLDFRALAAVMGDGENTATGRSLPERSRPFAEVAVAVLRGAGGQHRSLANRLEEAAQPRPQTVAPATERGTGPGRPRAGLLTALRPVVSPPDLPHMVGRKRELATITEALGASLAAPGTPERGTTHGSEPTLVIVEGIPGMGRNRLVQEYVRRHGGRHSFIHWINARREFHVREGLLQLWRALAPSGSPTAELPPAERLWRTLAEHQDWLIILDGVPTGTWPLHEWTNTPGNGSLLHGFPPAGRGCVVATTDALPVRLRPRATVVTLSRLTPEDLQDYLRTALGPAFDPADQRQSDALERMAGMMPRIPDQLVWPEVSVGLARLAGPAGLVTSAGAVLPVADTPPPRSTAAQNISANGFQVRQPVVAMTSLAGPDGRILLAAYSPDGRVRLWDPADGTAVGEPFTLHTDGAVAMTAIHGLAERPLLATIDYSGTVRLWDSAAGSRFGPPFRTGADGVLSMTACQARDGSPLLAISYYSGRVRLWDLREGEFLGIHLDARAYPGRAIASVPGPHDSRPILVTADYTGTVQLWDHTETPSRRPYFTVRPAEVLAMAALPGTDGNSVLATVGYDRTVRLWDIPLPAVRDTDPWARLAVLPGLDSVRTHLEGLRRKAVAQQSSGTRGESGEPVSPHLVFTGNPGTGKTMVARLLGDIHRELGLVRRGHVVEASARDLVADRDGSAGRRLHTAADRALDGVLIIEEADALGDTRGRFGTEIVEALLTRMGNDRGQLAVILIGYPERIAEFLEAHPALADRFGRENIVEFPDYEPEVLHEILLNRLRESGLRWGTDVEDRMRGLIAQLHASRDETFGNAREMNLLADGIFASWADRNRGEPAEPVLPEDLPEGLPQTYGERTRRPLPEPGELRAALDGLTGLGPVRRTVTDLVLRLRLRRLRGQDCVLPHLLFVGPPGTGRSTVARIIGELLHSLGLLRSGNLVRVTSADLIGRYVEETAQLTRDAVRSAVDGVLFIDEVDSFAAGPPGYFGQEAMFTLFQEMERWQGRLVVVCAGYPAQMEHFLAANPVVRSRFSAPVRFSANTLPELLEILRGAAAAGGYTLPPAVEDRAALWLAAERAVAPSGFDNARAVRRLLDTMASRMARRTHPLSAGFKPADGLFVPDDVPGPQPPQPRTEAAGPSA